MSSTKVDFKEKMLREQFYFKSDHDVIFSAMPNILATWFAYQKFYGLKLPNSSRKSIKKFSHFKIFTLQNVKFEMSGYSNTTNFESTLYCLCTIYLFTSG